MSVEINAPRPSYLYKIENTQNGKLYIGVSIGPKKRFIAHKSSARTGRNAHHIHHAMAQYIDDIDAVFKLSLIGKFPSEEEAYQEEIKLIAEYRALGIPIYNKSDGGDRGPVMFGEDNPFYGKHHSEETIRKISEANTGKFVGEKNFFYGKRFVGEAHPLFGSKRPQNVLDALSKAHKGKVISEELKMQWSNSHKGKQTGSDNPMYGMKGELNPNAGISDAKAIEIFNMYHIDNRKVKDIVEKTGVSKSTVDRVIYSHDRFVWTKTLKV